jgi:hypothetical protein
VKDWLNAAGRAFLFAFGAAVVVYVPGVLEAPDVDGAAMLGLAAVAASFTAGLAAVKQLLPSFSWKTVLGKWLPVPWISRLDIFTFTAAGTLIVSVSDVLSTAPNLSTWPSAFTAAATGALAAGFRTAVAAGTKGETPLSAKGK